jgi:hypothetical protein
MGNVLIDELPETLTVAGKEYAIRSDFRTALRVLLAFEDNGLTMLEKQMVLVENLFVETPAEIAEAGRAAIAFLDGGGDDEKEDSTGGGLRLYSFSKDANIIYAAFQQTHGIDLQKAQLHWWQFLALFMDMGADTTFCNLIGLRKRVKTGKASKEEKQVAQDMGSMFEVPDIDMRSLAEREADADFMEQYRQAKRERRQA